MANTFNAAKANTTSLQNLVNQHNLLIDILSEQLKILNATIANGLTVTDGILSITVASSSTSGLLSSTHWNTFNNKQNHNDELDALSALADNVGFVKKTGDATYEIDTSNYATESNAIAYAIALGG